MIIRDAQTGDYPVLLSMGEAFVKAAKQPPVDPSTLKNTFDQLRMVGVLKVAEKDTVCGALGALVFPNFWNAGELIAQELFFWVDKHARGSSAGVRLLDAAENECRERGASKLLMLSLDELDGERVSAIYRRRGYTPQERTFAKVL